MKEGDPEKIVDAAVLENLYQVAQYWHLMNKKPKKNTLVSNACLAINLDKFT